MPSEIVITGIPELLAKVGRMQALKVLAPPMVKAMARLQRTLATYPKASHRKMKFVSEKQRRYVMWLVSEGKVPYRRTHMLNNPMSYGPYVQSPTGQAEYHSGTWRTTDDVVKKHEAAIVADFKAAIDGALA
jgi:hypothetical protein